MKLVGTRIRVEKSEHKEEYFPEYCLEYHPWYKFGFGKPKQEWYGVSSESSHYFGEARRSVKFLYPYELLWARAIIDKQVSIMDKSSKEHHHDSTKQTSYIKYP